MVQRTALATRATWATWATWAIRATAGLATLCAVLLAAGPARALRGEVVEFGEVSASREGPALPQPGDDTLSPRLFIQDFRFINHSDTLDAQLCARFGLRVRLVPDAGETLPDTLTVLSIHPLLTRPDGASAREERFTTGLDGDTAYAGWTFDHAWELRAGDWTIAFQHDGHTLASHTFHVSVPRPGGSLCPGTPMS